MHVRVGDGLNASVDVHVPSDVAAKLPNPSSRNRLSEAEFLTSFEEALPQYASFVQRVMDDVAVDERLAIEWHASSFSIKLRDRWNSGNLFSVLNIEVSGKVNVWSLREQIVRSGLPAELADTYITSVGSALATTAVNAALKPPGTISQLSANYDRIKTMITGLADSVYSIRQQR
jgi:hypothetical protein